MRNQQQWNPKSGNPISWSHCDWCIVNRGKGDRREQVDSSKNIEDPPPAWPGDLRAIRMELLRKLGQRLSDRQIQPDTQTAAAFPEKWRHELGTSIQDVASNAKVGWEQESVAS